MPVSSGKCWTNFVKASSPPAEAPMPTIGNRTFDSDWALPLVPLTSSPEIAFLQVCVFIGIARSPGTAGDGALRRRIVILASRLFWMHPMLCFHKQTSQQDAELAVGQRRGFQILCSCHDRRLSQCTRCF